MKIRETRALLWCGYLVLAWGLLAVIYDSISRSEGHYPFNLGIILGLGAHLIIGAITVVIEKCMMTIENRLDRIENLDKR
jgi:hypothetical protein